MNCETTAANAANALLDPVESPVTPLEEQKQAAQGDLARGFAIFPLQPISKDVLGKYAPHGFYSASTVPDVALRAWHDGVPANHAVGCGLSDLAVIDADHGLKNYEEFETWRVKSGFPKTFTVRTGRRVSKETGEPEYGAQMYYRGAIDDHAFEINGVTGEIKSKGGYVVGAGCVHPDSHEKYEILYDLPVVPTPDVVKTLRNTKKDFTPKVEGGELIPAGSRWIHLQSKAGTFRNAGLDESGIYAALKNFAGVNCEDGENYSDDKIKSLAHAAFNKFEKYEQGVLIIGHEPEPIDDGLPAFPTQALEGDYLSDLTHELTVGTPLPPQLMRATIKTILGAMLDGLVGFPNHEDIHMRHWNMLIAPPDTGKGESWKRTGEAFGSLRSLMVDNSIGFPMSGFFSSGENLNVYLSEFENQNVVTYFDEYSRVFRKAQSKGSTIMHALLELYDNRYSSAGSLTHKGGSFKNVGLNMTGGFTPDGFIDSFAGTGAGSDGFLSRCVLSYSDATTPIADWTATDVEAVIKIVNQMRACIDHLKAGLKTGKRFIPTETLEAKVLREQFMHRIAEEKAASIKDGDYGYYSRIDSHFKRDLLIRTVFSPDQTITADKVKRSIAWADYEVTLRKKLWVVYKGTNVEQMEKAMKRLYKKNGEQTRSTYRHHCHVDRDGSGGEYAFNTAWSAMTRWGRFVLRGKTKRGAELWGEPKESKELKEIL